MPDWVRAQRTPIVVKASGLAAGKGVVIVDTRRRSHRHRAVDVRRPVRLRRATRSSSKNSCRARKPASSSWPTARTSWRSRRRRITSACATATRARIPAAWAPIRPRPWSRARCTNASCARSSSPPFAVSRKTARRTPVSCTPASWCIPTARPTCSSTTAASAIRRRSPS